MKKLKNNLGKLLTLRKRILQEELKKKKINPKQLSEELAKKFNLGFLKSAKIVDFLESKGIIPHSYGVKPIKIAKGATEKEILVKARKIIKQINYSPTILQRKLFINFDKAEKIIKKIKLKK